MKIHPVILILALLVVAGGLWGGDHFLDLYKQEKLDQIAALDAENDRLAAENAVRTIEIDSLETVIEGLTVERNAAIIAANSAVDAALDETPVEYPQTDERLAAMIDSASVIGVGRFSVMRPTLEEYLTLKNVKLPAYRAGLAKTVVALQADARLIDAQRDQMSAMLGQYDTARQQIVLLQEKSGHYESLFLATDEAYRREKRKTRLVVGGAIAATVAVLLLK